MDRRVGLLLGVLLLGSTCSSDAAPHRKLLQRSVKQCKHLHQECLSCSVQGINSMNNGTAMICLSCTSPSYKVTADAASCECCPGYHLDNAACKPCTKGSYCTGANSPLQSCGIHLTTKSATAAYVSACITQAGVAYMTGPTMATPCPVNTYNAGGNRRNCTECPGGLVTDSMGSTSVAACAAPLGYFYRGQQALPCSVGTYKEGINKNSNCKACPVGLTTMVTGSTSAAACSVTLAGFQATIDSEKRVTGAEPCPVGTFSPAGAGVCYPCAAGLTTQGPKSASDAACLAPPGTGYYASGAPRDVAALAGITTAAQASITAAQVLPCPIGFYKGGWNLEPCHPCGANVLTTAGRSESSDACYIPAGWGSKTISTGNSTTLVASKCTLGTIGVAVPYFGVSAAPCQACPEFTTTPDAFPQALALNAAAYTSLVSSMVFTSSANCSNLPGYGWEYGVATECPEGYYNQGFDLRPCTPCAEGLSTIGPGASNASSCIALPGWEVVVDAAAAVRCPQGTWGPGGTSPCKACPPGASTAPDALATSSSNCSYCLPGFGSTADATSSSISDEDAALCTFCGFGFYASGGPEPCTACDDGFTSSWFSSSSADCVPLYSRIDPYSSIAFSNVSADSALTRDNAIDAAGCQDACTTCQFWMFRNGQNDGSDGCWLKEAAAQPSPNTYIAYRIAGSTSYVVWEADAGVDGQLGNGAAVAAATSPTACSDACDAQSACVAYWVSANSDRTWQCRLLAGEFRKGVQSSVRAEPTSINTVPWEGLAHQSASTTAAANGSLPADSVAATGDQPVDDSTAINLEPAALSTVLPSSNSAALKQPVGDNTVTSPKSEPAVPNAAVPDSTTSNTQPAAPHAAALPSPELVEQPVDGSNTPITTNSSAVFASTSESPSPAAIELPETSPVPEQLPTNVDSLVIGQFPAPGAYGQYADFVQDLMYGAYVLAGYGEFPALGAYGQNTALGLDPMPGAYIPGAYGAHVVPGAYEQNIALWQAFWPGTYIPGDYGEFPVPGSYGQNTAMWQDPTLGAYIPGAYGELPVPGSYGQNTAMWQDPTLGAYIPGAYGELPVPGSYTANWANGQIFEPPADDVVPTRALNSNSVQRLDDEQLSANGRREGNRFESAAVLHSEAATPSAGSSVAAKPESPSPTPLVSPAVATLKLASTSRPVYTTSVPPGQCYAVHRSEATGAVQIVSSCSRCSSGRSSMVASPHTALQLVCGIKHISLNTGHL